jgi:hypothetical protein
MLYARHHLGKLRVVSYVPHGSELRQLKLPLPLFEGRVKWGDRYED